MPEDKSSMLSSTCCRWMANASRYPCEPNRKRTSSTTLGRRRQNCLFGWQIVSTSRMLHCLDGRRTRPSWNNLANPHLVQPKIHRVQIIHRNFAEPKWLSKWLLLFLAFETFGLLLIIWYIWHMPNTYKCVSIQENTFFELCQSPAVQFGECNA